MTHVLNYALRKTLGGEVDQKGSQVSDEKFRFDFSFNRAVNSIELSAIEVIVNDVVKADVTVHTEVVALKDALAVQGLRAVFGETYPDPVRVVSVGPKVCPSVHLSVIRMSVRRTPISLFNLMAEYLCLFLCATRDIL